ISDLFKDLKDRLSSPLISSFIIAWLVTNWRIVVGLAFYKTSELKLDGYYSYNDLITKNLNLKNNLFWPLLISILYTFLFPFFRNVILAFGAWIKRWGGDWTLNISKKGFISVANYLRLRDQYNDLIKNLVEITNTESETKNRNLELIGELKGLEREKNLLEDELKKIKLYGSIDILQGQWKFKYFDQSNKEKDEEFKLGDRANIYNQTFELFIGNKPARTFQINHIVGNLNQIILILNSNDGSRKTQTLVFRIENNFNFLNGKDDNGDSIQMERIAIQNIS
ncbi:MAG TPA: hypothetical protein VGM63_09730, partial [Mucilaginibacter sp.]